MVNYTRNLLEDNQNIADITNIGVQPSAMVYTVQVYIIIITNSEKILASRWIDIKYRMIDYESHNEIPRS